MINFPRRLILTVIVAIFGGVTGRMDGGGFFKTPEWVERLLCMLPFVVATIPFAGWYSIIALGGAVGLATGHGQYFLGRLLKAITPERVDFIVRWFFGKDWRTNFPKDYVFTDAETNYYNTDIFPKLYWRNVLGMFLTGTLVGLFAGMLSLYFGEWVAAALFFQTGIVKASAYIIGYHVFKNTESAEFINGFLRTIVALLAFWIVI